MSVNLRESEVINLEGVGVTKKCGGCKQEKNDEHFNRHRNRPDGLQDWCRLCMSEQNRKLRFGPDFTAEVFEAMLADQNYRCKICGDELVPGSPTNVDHCHSTGQVRGILCRLCNSGLGHFRDNPDFMRRAIEYLMQTGKEFSKAAA